jgi:hypothetical protein
VTDPTPTTPAETSPAKAPELVEPVEPATRVETTPEVVEVPAETSEIANTEVLEPEPVAEPAVVATAPAQQPIYVQAPTEPRRKSNRGVGVLLALLATVIFAALFAIAIAIIIAAKSGGQLQFGFLSNSEFYVPVLFFLVGFVIVVLIVNRARWWAHVIGSIFVALFVYFGTIGTLLLINGVIAHTPSQAGTMYANALVDPLVIAATLIAREVSLWIGFAISARGRRLTARNAEARASYDSELAARRAEYDRASA